VDIIKHTNVDLLDNPSIREKGLPDMLDYIKAEALCIPYPDILPQDDVLVNLSPMEICKRLSNYTRVPLEKIDNHFSSRNYISSTEIIGNVILNDIQTVNGLKIPGGRHTLAKKLEALIELGKYREHQNMMKKFPVRNPNPDPVIMAKAEEALNRKRERVRKELGYDIDNIPADFPIRLVSVGTMGHHQDAFHPSVENQSYYLKGDMVGGSSEIMILNKNLLTPEVDKTWDEEAMQKALSSQLNDRLHKWTTEPGIMYMSDMAPYLIRVAGCFEGLYMRYRVDPKKLWNIIGFLCVENKS